MLCNGRHARPTALIFIHRAGRLSCLQGQRPLRRFTDAFQFEQMRLGRQPAGKAGQRAITADHPMAGHDDGDRIAAVGGADGAGRTGLAQALGQLPVGARLAVRDLQQAVPDRALERRAGEVQRQVEALAQSGEIFTKLALGFEQHRILRSLAGEGQRHTPGALVLP